MTAWTTLIGRQDKIYSRRYYSCSSEWKWPRRRRRVRCFVGFFYSKKILGAEGGRGHREASHHWDHGGHPLLGEKRPHCSCSQGRGATPTHDMVRYYVGCVIATEECRVYVSMCQSWSIYRCVFTTCLYYTGFTGYIKSAEKSITYPMPDQTKRSNTKKKSSNFDMIVDNTGRCYHVT